MFALCVHQQVSIASLDRPEDNIKSLPRIIAESKKRDINEIYTNADKGILTDVTMLQVRAHTLTYALCVPSEPAL